MRISMGARQALLLRTITYWAPGPASLKRQWRTLRKKIIEQVGEKISEAGYAMTPGGGFRTEDPLLADPQMSVELDLLLDDVRAALSALASAIYPSNAEFAEELEDDIFDLEDMLNQQVEDEQAERELARMSKKRRKEWAARELGKNSDRPERTVGDLLNGLDESKETPGAVT